MKKNEDSLWYLWDTIKRTISTFIGIPEKEKGTESVFKAEMAENFPDLEREINIKVHEAQSFPNKLNLNRNTPRHIIKYNCQKSKRQRKQFWKQ